MKALLITLLVLAPLQAKDTCIDCHSVMSAKLQAPAKAFPSDIHQRAGFTCVDCHGGDRNSDDPTVAMGKAAGFRGKIARTAVPELCAKCHSDATLMHRFEPKEPVDQLVLYQSSVHGQLLAKGETAAPNCVNCHSVHNIQKAAVSQASAACGNCHALLQGLFDKSPHKAAFAAMGQPGCVTCHSNHAVLHPTSNLLAGEGAICSTCHSASSNGGKAALQMKKDIEGLSAAIAQSQEILHRASLAGMEVSEPLQRVQQAEEQLVKARVAVHNFRAEAVGIPSKEGMALAAETYRAGQNALADRDYRRRGLLLSLGAILLTLAGLWLMIRVIEENKKGTA